MTEARIETEGTSQQPVTPAVAEVQQPESNTKVLTQDHIDKLIKTAKLSGYEAGKQDGMAAAQLAHTPQMAQPNIQQPAAQMAVAPSYQPQQVNPAMGQAQQPNAMQGAVSPEDLHKLAQQEVARQMAEHRSTLEWQQTVNNFLQKAQRGAQKYADFNEVVSPLNLDQNRHLVTLTNLVDNTEDVLHDLGRNPSKVAQLNELSRSAPQLAIREIQNLSNSIKNNELALNQKQINEPLSQLKPSPVSTDSGDNLTVSDYRKKSYLRG